MQTDKFISWALQQLYDTQFFIKQNNAFKNSLLFPFSCKRVWAMGNQACKHYKYKAVFLREPIKIVLCDSYLIYY